MLLNQIFFNNLSPLLKILNCYCRLSTIAVAFSCLCWYRVIEEKQPPKYERHHMPDLIVFLVMRLAAASLLHGPLYTVAFQIKK